MPQWTAYAPPNSDKPHAITNEFGGRFEVPGVVIDKSREVPRRRFESDDPNAARDYLLEMHRKGVRDAAPPYHFLRSKLWRHRGAAAYVNIQVFLQGISQLVADKAKNNDQVRRISALLNQLTERYHKARKEDGIAVVAPLEATQVREILAQTRSHRDQLHALAAASDDMILEAYAAFGFTPPAYDAVVVATFGKAQDPVAVEPIAPPSTKSEPPEPGAIASTEPGEPGPIADSKPPEPKRNHNPKQSGVR